MSQVRDVTPEEAARMLETDAAVTYVDVRSTVEYTSGHVPRSVNVPLAEMDPMRGMAPNPDFVAVMEKLFKTDQALIVGCASGGRSRQACMVLAASGYTNMVNMAGGFAGGRGPSGMVAGWSQCGLPVALDGLTYAAARKNAGV